MKAFERFLKYVKFGTGSDENSGLTPSTDCQKVLAKALKEELEEMNIAAEYDDFGYVYAKIEASEGYESVTPIGFIAHMDTSPEYSGEGVKPQIFENYQGGDIQLGNGITLSASNFPHLKSLVGKTLITASGDTLLGADDKAGIAEIMTLAERIVNDKIPHGKILIAFTPDEEIGEGADHFDIMRFGAKYAYTVDGEEEGGVEFENFNASSAEIMIKGFSVHPGSSKDTMINAALVATEFNSMLPQCDIPRNTSGYQGFYHLCSIEGDVSEAKLQYIIRDHSAEILDYRIENLKSIVGLINDKYGEGTATIKIKEQYRNMAEVVSEHYHIVEKAVKATEKAGVKPFVVPIRGGTDGARLSFIGLPCPNLGTGGYAAHGPYEHITVEAMDKVTEILLNIVSEYVSEGK